jgi:membrane dipeptidase
MVIDASHSSDAALVQMLELSTAPIILSHSGLDAIYEHGRNISDDQLRSLAAKGGVLQINSVFLSRFNNSAARSPLYDQFDRISALTGEQVGTLARQWATLDRTERVNEGDFALYMRALLHCLEVVGADHCGVGADWDGGGGVQGFEDVTALPQITAALLSAGYSEADIAKIWGGNVLRLLRSAEAARSRR